MYCLLYFTIAAVPGFNPRHHPDNLHALYRESEDPLERARWHAKTLLPRSPGSGWSSGHWMSLAWG
ncbi:hypothetical protein EWH23_12330 [Meiothermus sp. PNK-Is4]|nr:hypothetical protein DNA98_16010 [Meiothermus sp. Pnk-1]RYM35263.1 hypothetical protein EWH23_12330 [Meiothermus sp. PNK-Is4]